MRITMTRSADSYLKLLIQTIGECDHELIMYSHILPHALAGRKLDDVTRFEQLRATRLVAKDMGYDVLSIENTVKGYKAWYEKYGPGGQTYQMIGSGDSGLILAILGLILIMWVVTLILAVTGVL